MEETVAKDDSDLVSALRAGEAVAFEQLVRQFGGRLLAASKRLLSNHEDALDAVQDALLSAFKSIESFDGRSRLSTWLHRIAVNAALMALSILALSRPELREQLRKFRDEQREKVLGETLP